MNIKIKLWKRGTFLGKKMTIKEKKKKTGYFNILLESKAVKFPKARMFPSKGIIILIMVAIFLIEIVLQL